MHPSSATLSTASWCMIRLNTTRSEVGFGVLQCDLEGLTYSVCLLATHLKSRTSIYLIIYMPFWFLLLMLWVHGRFGRPWFTLKPYPKHWTTFLMFVLFTSKLCKWRIGGSAVNEFNSRCWIVFVQVMQPTSLNHSNNKHEEPLCRILWPFHNYFKTSRPRFL